MRMGTVWYILLFIIPYREWSCVWAGHIWLGTPEWIKYEILLLEYCSFSIDEVTNTGPSFSLCLAYDTRLTCMSLLWHVISAQETAAKTKSKVSKGLRLVDCVCGICLCVSVYAGPAPVRACRGQRGPSGVLWSFSTLFPKTGSVTELEAAGEPQRSSFSTPHPACWGYGHACPCLTFHIHSEDPHTEAHTFEASALPHGTNSTVLITIFLNLVLLY